MEAKYAEGMFLRNLKDLQRRCADLVQHFSWPEARRDYVNVMLEGLRILHGKLATDWAALATTHDILEEAQIPNETEWRRFHTKMIGLDDWLRLVVDVVSSETSPEHKVEAHSNERTVVPHKEPPRRVFIGHGRSYIWLVLKDFLQGTLRLDWEEFNRESVAGKATTERLSEMLATAGFAFLVMTAEDELADGTKHARGNVIHEVGLFQGKLGFKRAIVLLEDGCSEFSNIHGLTQIRFPKGDILARSEEIRKVLQREGLLP
jgi:hypothetical protein